MGLREDLKKKLKEIGWSTVLVLLKWLLERLTSNPPRGEKDADRRGK